MTKKIWFLLLFLFLIIPLFFPVFSFEFVYSTPSAQLTSGSFDLTTYIIISIVYITIMHFAVIGGSEFSFWSMIGFFVLGGLAGSKFGYETGLITAIILSLIFISAPKKDL